MLKKIFSLLFSLLLALTFFAGCKAEPDDSAEIAQAEAIALEVAEAVMTYDLEVIRAHSLLGTDLCEQVNTLLVNELKTDDGKYDWDGLVSDTFDGFIEVYDSHNSQEYETLEVVSLGTVLHDGKEALAKADERELLNRNDADAALYRSAVAKLEPERVAVTSVSVTARPKAFNDPIDASAVTYEENTVTLEVYSALVDGVWKCYSPSIVSVFPPLAHFPRYGVAFEQVKP